MTPEEWHKVRPILESALELDAAKRPTFLDAACKDPALRREVESLILAHEQAGTDLLNGAAVPPFAVAEEARFRLLLGKRVGPYEIVEELAVGGMGAIYRAERADGQYRQQVAVKVVRAELGASLTAARFRNERQILASLSHPNIAKILDGGTTADGLPYFVMEFIDGLPITDYCDQHKLSLDARLEIFRIVCSAVHYAHQHLVIHRDLKPSNILVTEEGSPKLLDFGIAKILDPNFLPENTSLTMAGLWMMTPEYASPEQFRGEPITTASDVYSLGLVLYEVLTGLRAYKFPGHLPHEIARAVLETDPEKPSSAVRRRALAPKGQSKGNPAKTELVGERRQELPGRLHRRLSGDLDNIVLKVLRKEPHERYSSADQLSEDLRRHLEGLPVLARKSSLAYRLQKYVLRHKFGVAAATLVFFSLLTGIVLTVREARIARANELRAERRFNDVRALANSLIFEVHDAIKALPGATSARKVIVQRAQEYLDSLAAESGSDPSLLRELASAYARLAVVLGDVRDANLGNSQKAVEDYKHAIELRERVAAVVHSPSGQRELAESYLAPVPLLEEAGQQETAEDYINKALAILQPLATENPGDQEIQSSLASAFRTSAGQLAMLAKWPEVAGNCQKSLEIYQRLLQLDPKNATYQSEVSFAHKRMGGALLMQKQLQAALDEYQAALTMDEARIRANSEDASARYAITFTYSDIGWILGEQGKTDAALDSYRKSVEIRGQLAESDPKDSRSRGGLANNYSNMAWLLLKHKNFDAALENYNRALGLRQALAQQDPTNERKQAEKAVAQAGVGYTYFQMAFDGHTGPRRRAALCQQGQSWARPALPELQQHKKQLRGEEGNFIDLLQQALNRCEARAGLAR